MPPLPQPMRRTRSGLSLGSGAPIVVGLVNNMPDGALRATERQYRALLSAACGDRPVRLRLFSCPEVPRGVAGQQHLAEHYEPITALWTSELDGLIVTGAEPRAASIEDEPYWATLRRLIDWAGENTTSTVWSCLAAHAAVRHLDGIKRRRLPRKLSGVFDSVRATNHPLLGFGLSRWCAPHSRYNELAEDDLATAGYRVLARSAGAGVDLFVKQRGSLFVFLQGHPEYDPGTLLREYRRDVGRFLARERDDYPEMPSGYFRPQVAATMRLFEAQARRARDPELLSQFPANTALQTLTGPWCGAAVRLFANWLWHLGGERHAVPGWAELAPAVAANAPALTTRYA